MKNSVIMLVALGLLGCGTEEDVSSNEDNPLKNQKLSLNLDVVGDDVAIRRNKENPQSGFCDYYFSKTIETPSERNSLGFCYARSGDMTKAEMKKGHVGSDLTFHGTT